jgi:S1-C subfamily serine protease
VNHKAVIKTNEVNESPIPTARSTIRERLGRIGGFLRRGKPLWNGMLGAAIVLGLYNLLFPAPVLRSDRELVTMMGLVMASATPKTPRAVLVNQFIQPSLVLVRVQREPNAENEDGRSLGSGVIANDNGDVITALHVVQGAREIKLTWADGGETTAEIVTEQPESDIAVLRGLTPPSQIVPATMGNPRGMRIGDDAFVVGHPLGLYGSMSAGVISGFERTFTPKDGGQELSGLIQFDAAVNPGSSGAPLLNSNGEVVGIVTALVNPSKQEAFAGIGFAVPINVAGGAAGMPQY